MSYNSLNRLKRLRAKKMLQRLIFKEATKIEAFILEFSKLKIETDEAIKVIKVFYKGNAQIISTLLPGYHVHVGKNVIRIVNIMGRPLPKDGIIFRFQPTMSITSIQARNFFSKTMRAQITVEDSASIIGSSDTKFEDNTEILTGVSQIGTFPPNRLRDNLVNDVITGLYTNRTFPNGYSGYYHYYPKERLYMTKAFPSKESVPLINKKLGTKRSKSMMNLARRIQNRINITKESLDTFEDIQAHNIPNEKIIDIYKPIQKQGLKKRIGKFKKELKKIAAQPSAGGKY